MNIAIQTTYVLISYLIGSIPVGYLVTKYATGKNILEHGSGNIGSTNVKRIAGNRVALLTQLLDMAKGLIPVSLAIYLLSFSSSTSNLFIYSIALASILGHDFSLFLKFKGGKGVNTTLGASVLLAPYSVFIAVALYFIVKWRFKYVSLGSLVLGITMPLVEWIINGETLTLNYLLLCMLLIIAMHRQNIDRLIRQQELKS